MFDVHILPIVEETGMVEPGTKTRTNFLGFQSFMLLEVLLEVVF